MVIDGGVGWWGAGAGLQSSRLGSLKVTVAAQTTNPAAWILSHLVLRIGHIPQVKATSNGNAYLPNMDSQSIHRSPINTTALYKICTRSTKLGRQLLPGSGPWSPPSSTPCLLEFGLAKPHDRVPRRVLAWALAEGEGRRLAAAADPEVAAELRWLALGEAVGYPAEGRIGQDSRRGGSCYPWRKVGEEGPLC